MLHWIYLDVVVSFQRGKAPLQEVEGRMVLGSTRKKPTSFTLNDLALLDFSLGLCKGGPCLLIDQRPRSGGLSDVAQLPLSYDLAGFLEIERPALFSYKVTIYLKADGVE